MILGYLKKIPQIYVKNNILLLRLFEIIVTIPE